MAKKKPYRIVLYLLTRLAAGLIYALPRNGALAFGAGLAKIGYYAVARQRNKTLENLRRVYQSEKSEREIEAIAQDVFKHLTLTAIELLQFSKLKSADTAKWVDAGEAFKVYDAILAERKGLISVTAHLGNWELLAGVFGLKGYRGAVLARRIYYEPYNRWAVNLRQAVKVQTIYRDDSSKEILKRLARNEIIGLLPDQDMEGLKGVFVDFFGRPAYTAIAPARLSHASGAPILPNFLIRLPDNRYKLVLGEAIWPAAGKSREEDLKRMTEQWMAQFEKVIRQYPGQWAWMHNRWKTQPGKGRREKSPREFVHD